MCRVTSVMARVPKVTAVRRLVLLVRGSGSVIRNQRTILGTMQTRVTCSTCGGEGKISRTNVRSVVATESFTVKKWCR